MHRTSKGKYAGENRPRADTATFKMNRAKSRGRKEEGEWGEFANRFLRRARRRRSSAHTSAWQGERKEDCGLSLNMLHRCFVSSPCKAALPPSSLPARLDIFLWRPPDFYVLFVHYSWPLVGFCAGGVVATHNALARSLEEGRGGEGRRGREDKSISLTSLWSGAASLLSLSSTL